MKDPEYAGYNNKLRNGRLRKRNYYDCRINPDYWYSELAVHLCAYKKDVKDINRTCTAQHKKDSTYKEFRLCRTDDGEDVGRNVEYTISVFEGMPVIVEANTKTCCKGELGRITKVKQKYVAITTEEGETFNVTVKLIRVMINGKPVYRPTIQPAFAITIHKAQGLTLKRAIIHPRCFAEGQLYTALSRVASLEDIILVAPIRESDIKYNRKAIMYGME